MKKLYKIICLFAISLFAVPALAACGNNDGQQISKVTTSYEKTLTESDYSSYFSKTELDNYVFRISDSVMENALNKLPKNSEASSYYIELNSIMKMLNNSALGFNLFYKKLDASFIKESSNKKLVSTLEKNINKFFDNLHPAMEQFNQLFNIQDNRFTPVDNDIDRNLHTNIVAKFQNLIDACLQLSNSALVIYKNAIEAEQPTITEDTKRVINGSYEVYTLLNYNTMLSSYNKLFIKQLKSEKFYNLSDVASPAFNTNSIYLLGDKLFATTSVKYNEIENSTKAAAIKESYLKHIDSLNTFLAYKDVLDASISAFNFKDLAYNVRAGDRAYTKANITEYLETLDAESQAHYTVVANIFFNHFINLYLNPTNEFLDVVNADIPDEPEEEPAPEPEA